MSTTSIHRRIAQVVSITLTSCAIAQAPFALDTTFRTSIQEQYISSIAPLANGKVLLSGQIKFPGDMYTRGSAMVLADGTKDPAFPMFPFTTGGGKLTAWNGYFYVGTSQTVQRLDGNGLIDGTFIHMNQGPYFSSLQGGDYHVFPDGRVLMSGAHNLDYPAGGYDGLYNLIWFTNTGYLDTTRVHRKGNGVVSGFEQLADGGFICSSTCSVFDGQACDRFFKTHADGSIDTTYHTGVNWGEAFAFLPLADGRTYAGGLFRRNWFPNDTLRIVRLLNSGALDPGFTQPQFTRGALPDNGFGPTLGGISPYHDGKIFVMGSFQFVNGQPRRGICVLDSTGILQPEFEDCGVGPFTYMGLTYGSVRGITLSADSTHYYIWGTYNGYDEGDGPINDPLQRFVSRLHLGDITTSQEQGQEQEQVAGILLYPNPASATATLELEEVPRDAQVVLRDALGRVVWWQRVSDQYTTLQLQALPDGLYHLQLVAGNKRVAHQRIVVQR